MKTNLNILPILCFLLLWSCKSGNASSQTKNEVSQDTIKTFTLPAIPQIMVAPEQRAEFLVKHYWDNVNFADTNYIHHPEIAQKNRIGTKAINFTYTLASGAQGSLYQLNADYLLLFINNPGCHACTETIEGLKQAPIISQLIKEKKLIVLSIYPDEELDDWRKHLNEFPKEWINGYDKKFTIKEKQLYDLKAIPTLYLLNKEKTVLLKDATAQAIEEYLMIHQ